MSQEEFAKITEEVNDYLLALQEEMARAASFEHGYKAAAKRARKLARELKNSELAKWIKASIEAC